ncbi:MAG: hypothetical protein RH860_02460 [Cytophagales bacterium]
MKYLIVISTIIILLTFNVGQAQNIESMAGLRLGGTTALTYKKMFSNLEAFEIMMSGRENGIQLTALYEKHKPMAFSLGDNFYGYYGFGGHIGYVQSEPVLLRSDSSGQYQYRLLDIRRKTFFTMGVDAIVGVEYHIYSVPMAFALDIKPALELVGMRYLRSRVFDFGVSAKYIF